MSDNICVKRLDGKELHRERTSRSRDTRVDVASRVFVLDGSMWTHEHPEYYWFVVRADRGDFENGDIRFSPVSNGHVYTDYTTVSNVYPKSINGIYHPDGREAAEEFYKKNIIKIDGILIMVKDTEEWQHER